MSKMQFSPDADFVPAMEEITELLVNNGQQDRVEEFHAKCETLRVKNAHTAWLTAVRKFGIKPPKKELPGVAAKLRW